MSQFFGRKASGWQVVVEDDVVGVVEEAQVPRPGVQVDAAVE